mgnify:CR=1 FL=1
METSPPFFALPGLFPCSYRTYEEWKREAKTKVIRASETRSYRTYEEWKPPHHLNRYLATLCSYRTYEEWKLRNSSYVSAENARFLPYL